MGVGDGGRGGGISDDVGGAFQVGGCRRDDVCVAPIDIFFVESWRMRRCDRGARLGEGDLGVDESADVVGNGAVKAKCASWAAEWMVWR